MSTVNERKKLFAETIIPAVNKHGFVELSLSRNDQKTVKTHWYNWRRLQRIATGLDPAEHIVLRVTPTGLYFSLIQPSVLAQAMKAVVEDQQELQPAGADNGPRA
jgi:hypothetical protein